MSTNSNVTFTSLHRNSEVVCLSDQTSKHTAGVLHGERSFRMPIDRNMDTIKSEKSRGRIHGRTKGPVVSSRRIGSSDSANGSGRGDVCEATGCLDADTRFNSERRACRAISGWTSDKPASLVRSTFPISRYTHMISRATKQSSSSWQGLTRSYRKDQWEAWQIWTGDLISSSALSNLNSTQPTIVSDQVR